MVQSYAVYYEGQNRGDEQTLLSGFGGSLGNVKMTVVGLYMEARRQLGFYFSGDTTHHLEMVCYCHRTC